MHIKMKKLVFFIILFLALPVWILDNRDARAGTKGNYIMKQGKISSYVPQDILQILPKKAEELILEFVSETYKEENEKREDQVKQITEDAAEIVIGPPFYYWQPEDNIYYEFPVFIQGSGVGVIEVLNQKDFRFDVMSEYMAGQLKKAGYPENEDCVFYWAREHSYIETASGKFALEILAANPSIEERNKQLDAFERKTFAEKKKIILQKVKSRKEQYDSAIQKVTLLKDTVIVFCFIVAGILLVLGGQKIYVSLKVKKGVIFRR